MALVAFMALERQIYLDIFKEQSLRLLTFQTFARSDEKTRPDKQKYKNTMTKITAMTMNTFQWVGEGPKGATNKGR